MNFYKKELQFDNYFATNKWPRYIFFLIYLALLIIVSSYHEPWHDEGQAWLIARDDSLWQLLTVTTHYEGHPPLWYLMLMPFAKMGLPFEIGIKSINIFFASLATWFVLFKSPLPWYLRLFIPFSYFYFYQYGVINRSYSLLLATMMATAYYYPSRKQKPYILTVCLAIMSATMAYGMAIACGIALSWLCEIINALHIKGILKLNNLWNEKSFKALLLLLFFALINVYFMLPKADAAFFPNTNTKPLVVSFLYSIFVIPGQIICSNNFKDFFQGDISILFSQDMLNYFRSVNESGIYGVLLLLAYLLSYSYGVFFILFLLYISYLAKKVYLLILPLLAYSLLAAFVFWNSYHAGIMAGFFVFFLWQLYADDHTIKQITISLQKQFSCTNGFIFAKYVYYMAIVLILGINIYWSFSASWLDLHNQYDASREIANYIKTNHLEGKSIWIPPTIKNADDKYITIGTYAINAYFKKNVIENLDGGNAKRSYHEYKLLPKNDTFKKMQSLRKPDYIIATSERDWSLLQQILNDKDQMHTIKVFQYSHIWKDSIMPSSVILYGK
jgi:hypothetical protein